MQLAREPLPPLPAELEADHRGDADDERTCSDETRPFRIWRGDASGGGKFADYTTEVSEGMVVLDAVHQIQAEQATDLAVPLELQGRQVRLVLGRDQRQAAADVHDAARRAADLTSR